MKQITMKCKHAIAAILLTLSFSTFATDLPDPEVLAKQYLKDLCTLNEQDFTRKYMLTQTDVVDLINTVAANGDQRLKEELSDSLQVRSHVHRRVVQSYKSFREWQSYNHIDSSKLKYHSCDFELEKKRKLPFYAIDDMTIYFSYDSLNYAFSCDEFIFIKTKWIAGDFDGIVRVDKNFNEIYDDYGYGYDYASPVDTVAMAAPVYEEGEYVGEPAYEEDLAAPTKKQLKIQKKMDAYYRKIDLLSNKYYE